MESLGSATDPSNFMILKAFKLSKDINLGFSCGKDSIAFAHYLREGRHNINLIHVYNGLEGDNVIEEKAIAFAKAFNFRLTVCVSKPEHGNLENECRNARMRAFQDYDHVLLGHHLGDCVENYLNNCFCGNHDYQPMKFVGTWQNTTIFRPFLMISPTDINEYLDRHALKGYIAEDKLTEKSNRHWMRTQVIPLIHQGKYNLESAVRKMLKKQLDVS